MPSIYSINLVSTYKSGQKLKGMLLPEKVGFQPTGWRPEVVLSPSADWGLAKGLSDAPLTRSPSGGRTSRDRARMKTTFESGLLEARFHYTSPKILPQIFLLVNSDFMSSLRTLISQWWPLYRCFVGQSRPLFVYLRPFHSAIQKSIDVILIRTRGFRMVGAYGSIELWRPFIKWAIRGLFLFIFGLFK